MEFTGALGLISARPGTFAPGCLALDIWMALPHPAVPSSHSQSGAEPTMQVVTFIYPRPGDLDEPARLADVLGSFWNEVFPDHAIVQEFVGALAGGEQIASARFQDLYDSLSRFTVPVWQRQDWQPLELKQSLATQTGTTYRWQLPAALKEVPAIFNRITEPSLSFINNIDYQIEGTTITFRLNPLSLDNVYVSETTVANVVTDRTAQLWMYRAAFDQNTVFEQYGYVLDLVATSSVAYKALINAIYDGAVSGSSRRVTEDALSAITGVALAHGTELVTDVFNDDQHLWICTSEAAYGFHPQAEPLVAVDDTVYGGQALVDTLQIYDLNRGQIPAGLTSLTITEGILATGFQGGLTFENARVPLEIDQDEDGRTRVEFAIGGLADDVTLFWQRVHAAGSTYGATLAHLLDTRPHQYVHHELESFSDSSRDSFSELPIPLEEPTLAALPPTINPLEFLLQNVLRNNTFLIVVKPATFGADALGLDYLNVLRRIVPPQTFPLVVTVG